MTTCLKLVDFGLARSVDAEPESGSVTDAHPVLCPGKDQTREGNFSSDMHSPGCTLYQALTGYPPFDAPTVEELVAAHVNLPLRPPNQVLPEVTQMTSDVLVKVLSKEPRDRFLSYDEFRMSMEASRSQLLVQQYAQSDQPKPKSKTSWWQR